MKKIFVFCTTLLMVGMAQAQFPANLNEDSWQQSMNRIYVTGNVMDVELVEKLVVVEKDALLMNVLKNMV